MEAECPGRRSRRNLDSIVVRCPKCGVLVEMFNDEQKVRCRCGEAIMREAIPTCVQWCPAAERCLGQVVDLREVKKRLQELQSKNAGEYVARVGEQARVKAAARRDKGSRGRGSGGRGGK